MIGSCGSTRVMVAIIWIAPGKRVRINFCNFTSNKEKIVGKLE